MFITGIFKCDIHSMVIMSSPLYTRYWKIVLPIYKKDIPCTSYGPRFAGRVGKGQVKKVERMYV